MEDIKCLIARRRLKKLRKKIHSKRYRCSLQELSEYCRLRRIVDEKQERDWLFFGLCLHLHQIILRRTIESIESAEEKFKTMLARRGRLECCIPEAEC